MTKRAFLFVAVLLLSAFAAPAQQVVDNSTAVSTVPFRVATLEPGSCAVGQYYWNTTMNIVRRCISANVWADGNLPGVKISTSSPVTVSVVGWHLNDSAGAITYNLPAVSSANIGAQYCFRNAVTRTGVITITAPAATFIDAVGVNGAAAGTYVSAGAAGDAACMVAVSATQYLAYPSRGTWTNN